ncbi:MAG: aspartyl/asparaginyl beta-hydroxylase domain-containing protein [Sphingomicrobium sp.]
MQLDRPFLKLPIRFDADLLEREVRALAPSAWVLHPTGYAGNEAVRLVTVGGAATDSFDGPMKPTENLALCPYIAQAMSALGGVWGRSRLMGLGAGAEVPEHVDAHYHWRTHLRIHVPIITSPAVEFTCGGETVHMAPGECWVFDSFRWHEVHNRGTERRVHLVLDTVVTEPLWEMIDAAKSGNAGAARLVAPSADAPTDLRFEQVNAPRAMSPWEVRGHLAFIDSHVGEHPARQAVFKRLDKFADGWAALWAQYGTSDAGLPSYRERIDTARADLQALGYSDIKLDNELQLSVVLDQLIFIPAIAAPAVRPTLAATG